MRETSDNLAIPFSTVAELLARHAGKHPEKTALVDLDGGKEIDFAALRETVDRIAAWLESTGVGRGGKVVVLADERIEKLLVFLAVWRIGAIACPFHVEMSVAHLRAIVTYIDPRLVLWHTDLDGDGIVEGLGYPSIRFLYGRLPGRKVRFRCDGQADCSFVSGLSVRDLMPAGLDGICRSAPHFLRGLYAPHRIQA